MAVSGPYLGNIAKDHLGSEADEQLHSAFHIHLLPQPLCLNHCTLIFASRSLVHTCTANSQVTCKVMSQECSSQPLQLLEYKPAAIELRVQTKLLY